MPTDPKLRRTRGRLLLALGIVALVAGRASGQSDSSRRVQPSSQGFTLVGASGLVSVLSPVAVGPGNIVASFSRSREAGANGASATPVAIGYGVARFSEAWLGFDTRVLGAGVEANDFYVGLKAAALRVGALSFGAAGEYRLSESTAGGLPSENTSTITAQALLGVQLGNRVYIAGNAGYAIPLRPATTETRGPTGGLGMSVAPASMFMIVAEATVLHASRTHPEYRASAGARFFAFDNFQIIAAYQSSMRNGKRFNGVVVGIGFCSQLLQTTRDAAPEPVFSPELPSLEDLEKPKTPPDDSQK